MYPTVLATGAALLKFFIAKLHNIKEKCAKVAYIVNKDVYLQS